MKLRLTQKLVISIEVVVILISCIGGFIAFRTVRETLLNQTRSQTQSISTLKEQSILSFLNRAKSQLNFLATNSTNKEIVQRYLLNKKEVDKELIKTELLEILSQRTLFSSLYILDQAGQVVISTEEKDEGKIKTSEEYFLNPQTQAQTETQYFSYDSSTGITILTITSPIKNVNGSLSSLLVGNIDISEINKLMMERSGFGNTGETFLINSSSVTVTELLKEPGLELKKVIFRPQVKECLAGASISDEVIDYHGDKALGFWKWVPELKSCLVTKIDLSEVLAPLNQLAKNLAYSIGILSIVVGTLGYYLSKLILKPIEELRNEANKIKLGNYSDKPLDVSGDEIGEVTQAFNSMSQRLKESYTDLEEKVKQKTSELSVKITELSSLNQKLEQKDYAVLNLLEDARDLEHQLKTEKENIERKVDERTEELTNAKTKLTASISSLPIGFVMVDDSHHISFLNKKSLDILGMTANEINSSEDIFNKFPKDSNLHELHKAFHKENKSVLVEGEVDYGSKTLKISFVPISNILPISQSNEKASNLGSILLFEDITEAKILERSKDEFFSIASHELRTPLTAIRGNISMIQDYYPDAIKDPELNTMIDDIHKSSTRLIRIVNEFLNVSRLEQGKMIYDLKPIELDTLITETVTDYKAGSEVKNISLEYTPLPNLPKVICDSDKVREIIINLVGNALKFTDKGGIKITTEVLQGFVKVLVSDTGRGIPLKQQSLLFHKFQQAGSSLFTRDTVSGTGLGLYISKLMAEGMHGELKLESSVEGQGSVFSFTLPIDTGEVTKVDNTKV